MENFFENEIALVLIVKNESRYIKEWLEYHYRIGVDKFYIYNNGSEDRSELLEILQPWIESSVVEFEDFFGSYRQIAAYNDAIEKHRFDCRWMGFIDTDEFIYIKTGQTLPEFLYQHFHSSLKIAGLGINWRMFGTSGRESYEPLDVIDRFTFRAKDHYDSNSHIKTILNPRRIFYMKDPHSGIYMLNCGCYDENVKYIDEIQNPDNLCQKIQLNHYYTKSVQEYLEKCMRGRADCDLKREETAAKNPDLNAVEDVSLRDFWRRLKSQPLPSPKNHDPIEFLSHLEDAVRVMENPGAISDSDTEKLVTYFMQVRKSNLLGSQEKFLVASLILARLRDILLTELNIFDFMLVALILPEIIESRTSASRDIVNLAKSGLVSLLIEKSRDELEPSIEIFAKQTKKFLELFD